MPARSINYAGCVGGGIKSARAIPRAFVYCCIVLLAVFTNAADYTIIINFLLAPPRGHPPLEQSRIWLFLSAESGFFRGRGGGGGGGSRLKTLIIKNLCTKP